MKSFCVLAVLLSVSAFARADVFDLYYNPILAKYPGTTSAEKVKELTPGMMVEQSRVLPGITAAFVVVKNNEGRFAKLLVHPARQKISKTDSVPILLIERYVTFVDGEERAVQAQGKNIRLFPGFHFNLDLGQVVPASVPADLVFVADKDTNALKPVDKAEMYLVTKHMAEAMPKKEEKVVVGATFEPRYFNGVFKLYDDGRRSGDLHFKVETDGNIVGHYYSDKDGKKYEVTGKVGDPHHHIQFRIQFPRTLQFFQGLMFTGDGKAIAGSSKLEERETAFYAVRQE